MFEKLKKIELINLVIPILVAILMSVFGILYAQQNKKIEKKVDNAVLEQMIKVLEVQQRSYEVEQQSQKTVDKETLLLLQQMKIQLLLLNQKITLEEK